MDLSRATTEARNPDTLQLDRLSSLEIVTLMNREDRRVPEAVELVLPVVAQVVDAAAERLARGGRLFYVGAGTSGRLGVLDASECPPTFGTNPEQVQGILAGGLKAFSRSVEEAEDDPLAGAAELEQRGLSADDVVVGISASGRTPFVLGAVRRGREVGAATAGIYCNPSAPLADLVEHGILLEVGPEVLSGSTRLKAGTATKMVLNMISTAAMVRNGRCLGNLMIDVMPSCDKLRDRSVRILSDASGLDREEAARILEQAGGELRLATVMARGQLGADQARELLASSPDLRQALERAQASRP
ncbi:MAG: N-acetylmuramic acid 6-phosphate etherase [Armatimonadetes bacterium]|nr:N-acetylmuramic acid 6-phosphate etherase [Armatimonadota bacterium]